MGRARGAAVITAADHFDDVFGAKRGSGRVDVVYSPETASGRIALLRIAGIEPLVYAGGARLLIHHETEGDPKVVVASGGELWVHDDMTVYAYGDTEVVMRDQTTAFVYDNVEVSNTFGAGITIHGFGHSRLCVDSGVVANAHEHCSVQSQGGATIRARGDAYIAAKALDKVRARERAVVRASGGRVDAGGESTVFASGKTAVKGSGRAKVIALDESVITFAPVNSCIVDAYGFAVVTPRDDATVNKHSDGVTVNVGCYDDDAAALAKN